MFKYDQNYFSDPDYCKTLSSFLHKSVTSIKVIILINSTIKMHQLFHAQLFNALIFDDESPWNDMIYLNLCELSSEKLDN